MLQNSGERFLPSQNRGAVRHEHLHRYALCRDLVRGRDVLDVASGEGYGSAMLAQSARSVIGVDVAHEAVEFARHNYYYANARFLVGDCAALPLVDASADVIVSFETIEHHDRHDAMLSEFRRVLRPDGTVVISSPNRLVYSDEPGYVNPFHVKELYFDEFVSLLKRHFRYVGMYGQRIAAASFVYPLNVESDGPVMPYVGTAERIEKRLTSLKSPMYFIAVCANDADRILECRSLFIDAEDDLVRAFEEERRELVRQVRELSRELGQIERSSRDAAPLISLPVAPRSLIVHRRDDADDVVAAQQELDAERASVRALLTKIAELESEHKRSLSCAADELESERALTVTLKARLSSAQTRQEALQSELDAAKMREVETASSSISAMQYEQTIDLLQSSLTLSQRALRAAKSEHMRSERDLMYVEQAARTAQAGLQEATASRAWRFANRLRRAVGRGES